MTKIDIISGFLGAGKTTLIKKMLQEAFKDEKVVLIENEFGEIGIDGGFLKDAGVQITEMNSGCICCSLVGDFGTALKDVLNQFKPDRIIIEPSGVGKLSDVIKAVQDVQSEIEIELNNLIAVVDATKCKMYMKNFGEFFNNQVESAKTIILSRTGKMNQEKLDVCVKMLREHNEGATIVTTEWNELSGKQILEACEKKNDLIEQMLKEAKEHQHHHHDHDHEGGECCCGHDHEHEHHHDHDHEDGECCCGHDHEHEHHHDHDHEDGKCCCGHDHSHEGHHHADDVFTSWGVETPRKYTKEEVKEALEVLSKNDEYGMILRAKGMLPTVDGQWIYFDLVPGEYELREGSPEVTGRLCVIGSKIKEDEIAKLFQVQA